MQIQQIVAVAFTTKGNAIAVHNVRTATSTDVTNATKQVNACAFAFLGCIATISTVLLFFSIVIFSFVIIIYFSSCTQRHNYGT
jgi:hypothetical protein